jgi:hypothetical protein
MLSSYLGSCIENLGIRACENQKPPFLGLRNDNIISISRDDEPLQARTEARKVRAPYRRRWHPQAHRHRGRASVSPEKLSELSDLEHTLANKTTLRA